MRRLVIALLFVAALGAAEARAEPPPPPITTPPPAGTTVPPAEAIVDTYEPTTDECSGWELQNSYGGYWLTDATWWEYSCRPSGVFIETTPDWRDHYYWDGSQAVFYGHWNFWWDEWNSGEQCGDWWDEAAQQWYGPYICANAANAVPIASFAFSCSALDCSFDATASSDSGGVITAYHWEFGDGTSGSGATVAHAYAAPGTYTVTLTVTDDGGASDTESKTIVVNAPPTASFTLACSGLSCSFDGGASADSDGTVASYSWSFGDGSSVSGSSATAAHGYAAHGTYTATLTVTDDDGATASHSTTFTTISLGAQGYKLKGTRMVDLSWTGSSAESFDVYRDGSKIATVAAVTYTDNIGGRGSGTFTYQVCRTATSICSNAAPVTF